MELHYPTGEYGDPMDVALNKLAKFWSDGTFVIMNMAMEGRQLRVFTINTVNQECIKKFLC